MPKMIKAHLIFRGKTLCQSSDRLRKSEDVLLITCGQDSFKAAKYEATKHKDLEAVEGPCPNMYDNG